MEMEFLEKVENFFLNILKKIKLGFLAKIYEKHREGMRYLVFGALATIVNLVVYVICAKMLFVGLEEAKRVDYSNYIAIGTAMIFAYICNKLFVFNSKTNGIKELLTEIGAFVGCRIFSAIVEILIMRITVVNLGWDEIEILLKIFTNIIVMILNFIFSKIVIFKKGANKNEEKSA